MKKILLIIIYTFLNSHAFAGEAEGSLQINLKKELFKKVSIKPIYDITSPVNSKDQYPYRKYCFYQYGLDCRLANHMDIFYILKMCKMEMTNGFDYEAKSRKRREATVGINIECIDGPSIFNNKTGFGYEDALVKSISNGDNYNLKLNKAIDAITNLKKEVKITNEDNQFNKVNLKYSDPNEIIPGMYLNLDVDYFHYGSGDDSGYDYKISNIFSRTNDSIQQTNILLNNLKNNGETRKIFEEYDQCIRKKDLICMNRLLSPENSKSSYSVEVNDGFFQKYYFKKEMGFDFDLILKNKFLKLLKCKEFEDNYIIDRSETDDPTAFSECDSFRIGLKKTVFLDNSIESYKFKKIDWELLSCPLDNTNNLFIFTDEENSSKKEAKSYKIICYKKNDYFFKDRIVLEINKDSGWFSNKWSIKIISFNTFFLRPAVYYHFTQVFH